MEYWNGSGWGIQSAPSPAGAYLLGVSCTSTTNCEAVGADDTGALAEGWNGSTWSTQTIPGSHMSAVSCTSSSNCEAVGWQGADVWYGSTWTAQTISTPGEAQFTSVSCASASNCTVVGITSNPITDIFRGLAEYWNGSTWTRETFVEPGSETAPFGVSCGSATSCVAVGYYNDTLGTESLIEYWNGSTWTQASHTEGSLNAVSCNSGTSCTAVGEYDTGSGTGATLAASWDGTTWTFQAPPNPIGVQNAGLNGVSCPSATDCSAVGGYSLSISEGYGFAEQWTG